MYRHPDDEPIEVSRKPDFKLRKHLHFFRPFYEDFIAALLTHPRVKLAFYTSITHKNALPLLFQLFESAHLKVFKSDLFALFGQEFNEKDPGEGRQPWATRRSLEKVFAHPKS